MSTWWQEWAERIAQILAERWVRSKPGDGGPPEAVSPHRPAEPDRDTPPRAGGNLQPR